MNKQKSVAFMSYVRADDEHDKGRLTDFCNLLSKEVKAQTGEEFPIFQDRSDIKWGQNWKGLIEDSLDTVTFLIPIITPSFFKSIACREELERFIKREKNLNRNDLILPVYHISTPLIDDKTKRATDELAQVISDHQLADWRKLRFKSFSSSQVRIALEKLALQIREAIERVQASQKEVLPESNSRAQDADNVSETDSTLASESLKLAAEEKNEKKDLPKEEELNREQEQTKKQEHNAREEENLKKKKQLIYYGIIVALILFLVYWIIVSNTPQTGTITGSVRIK